ncbi:hypothetical protein ACQ4M3_19105 [Leptolyngbya sp. AN03gr2]|uniref:hypothetical protein n=1 Tax=Leptolyngbya sp. AN03gr2 TaxID=3423364 RepID=UPI003D318500
MSEFPIDDPIENNPIEEESLESSSDSSVPEIGEETRRFVDRVSDSNGDSFSLLGEAGRNFRSPLDVPRFSDRFRDSSAFNREEASRAWTPKNAFASEQVAYRTGEDLQVRAGALRSGVGLSALEGIEPRSYASIQTPSRTVTNQLTVFERKSDERQVQTLIESVYDLQRKLGSTAITRVTPRYAYKIVNGRTVEVPVGVQVAVRNFNEGFLKSSLFERSPLVHAGEHTFNLTADARGAVIDTRSNRYINGAAFVLSSSGGEQRMASGIETAVGLIATYARSTHFEARTGLIDTAFNAMVARGDYTSFGFVFGQYQQKFIRGLRERRSSFNRASGDLDSTLKAIAVNVEPLDSRLGLTSEEQSVLQVSLYQKRLEALRSAFSGEDLNLGFRQLAKTMQRSQVRVKLSNRELELDLFGDLKRAALESSPYGKNYYNLLKGNLSSGVLDTLYAPFMQPHEASYSANQLQARVGLYQLPNIAGAKNIYDLLYAEGIYYLNASSYRHGDLKTQAGFFTKPIGSTVSGLVDAVGEKKVATFFVNQELFTSSPQLNTTSISRVMSVLRELKYEGREALRRDLQKELSLLSEEEEETIFLMPFKKPEQMSQRLKNFLGTRSARELNLDLQSALDQGALDRVQSYLKRDEFGYLELDYGKALAGNINTALPTQQFQLAQKLRQDLVERIASRENISQSQVLGSVRFSEEIGRDLTRALRERDVLPTEMRGLIGGRNDRRVLVGFGATELSDFYYANSDYQASYSDLHLSKLRIHQVQQTLGEGGAIYESNVFAGDQLSLLQRTFQPGSVLYYSPQKINNTETLRVLQNVFDSTDLETGLRLQGLKNQFKFIDSISVGAEGKLEELVVKPGLYQFDKGSGMILQTGELRQSELSLGLQKRLGRDGREVLSEYTVKIPGAIRGFQGGKAVVAGAVSDTGEVPFLITFPNVAGMRSGVDFTKGPAVFLDGSLFREFDKQYARPVYSRDTQSDQLFGLMSPSAFKGYTYETGLNILRDESSRAELARMNVGEMGVYFSLLLAGNDKGLKKSIEQFVSSEVSSFAPDQKAKLISLLRNELGTGASRFKNLILQAPALVSLAGERNIQGNPLEEIKSRLRIGFESALSGNLAPLEAFGLNIKRLFERSIDNQRSFETTRKIGSEFVRFRVFEENDPYVRSAALVADVLSTFKQAVSYRGLASGRSMLSLNLADEQGKVSVERFLDREKNGRDAILNLAYWSGITLPGDQEINQLISEYRSGRLGRDARYQRLEEGLTNLYYQSQSSILVQRAIKFLPSRIMVPTGSEDSVGLEYHYSLSLSNRALQELRGRGIETEELAQAQTAYSVVSTYGNPFAFRKLRLISAFDSGASLSQDTLEHFSPLSTSIRQFGENQNQTLLERIIDLRIKGDEREAQKMLQGLRGLSQFVESGLEGNAAERAALYLDPRRGTLQQNKAKTLISGKRYVFFDIETYDLINSDFAEGDARRYPKHLAELAYGIRNEQGETIERQSLLIQPPKSLKEIPNKFRDLDFSSAVSDKEAVSTFLSRLNSDDVLVGHNVRRFDIPALKALSKTLNVDSSKLETFKVIDTLTDIDKQKTKARLRTGGFSLEALYKSSVRSNLLRQLETTALDSTTYEETVRRLSENSTFEYDAHRALADVEANIKVFDTLKSQGLLQKTQEVPIESPFKVGVAYFGYSGDVSHRFRFDVANYVSELHQSSKGFSLVYEFEKRRSELRKNREFRERFDSGLEIDLVLDHIRYAIDQSTDRAGKLKFKGENVSDQIVGVLIDSDRQFEEKVKESLTGAEDRFITSMQEQAKYLRRFVRSGKGTESERTNARQMLSELTQTRAFVLPDIAEEINPQTGKVSLRVYGEGLSSAPILGLDVLSSVPRQFKDHVSEVVKTQRELRELTSEYSEISRRLKQGLIENATERERYVVERFSRLALQANEQMADLGGSVLKQRAYGERVKYPGVSFIAAASSLLGVEEAAFGSRIGSGFLEVDETSRRQLNALQSQIQDLEARRDSSGRNSTELVGEIDRLNRSVQTLKTFIGEDPGLYARANRAGGPFQASIVEQEVYARPIQETVVARSKSENTLLQISEKGNETALFLSMFGRFGTQGGDFDGDAYQLIFGFKQGQKDYLTALERWRELSSTARILQQDLDASVDSDYLRFRSLELDSVRAEMSSIGQIIQRLESDLPTRQKSIGELRDRAISGIRRHTAAYFGAPTELFSQEAGVFDDREVLTMIEQQRGILSQLDNYASKSNLNNDKLLRVFSQLNRQDEFGSNVNQFREFVENQAIDLDETERERLIDLVERNKEKFSGLERLSTVERESLRFNRFAEIASEQSALTSFVGEYSSMISAASGIAMGTRTFEAMQTVIGSQGTSLIGEAYNAITTLGPQAMTARAFAEVLGGNLTAVKESGLEKSESFRFAERLVGNVNQLFEPSESRDLIGNLFGANVESFAKSAIDRAEDITGKLAVIQQVIRDSLKLKEAGGLLTAIKKVSGGSSFETRFLAESNDATRFSMLRDFISRESGTFLSAMDQRSPFMGKAEVAPINQFGALLLLSDYMRAEDSFAVEQMVSGRGRYEVLNERREFFKSQVESSTGSERVFAERMATDSDYLMRQTVLDLMNSVVAEKQIETMLQSRNAVEQTKKIRESYIAALGGEERFKGLRSSVEENRALRDAYDITESDVESFKSQQQMGVELDQTRIRDVFSVSEIERLGGEFNEETVLARARRINYDANLAYRSNRGITERDLISMRKTLQASRGLRFHTEEVAIDFRDFVSAEAENLEAFRMYSRREHLGSPTEYKLLQTQMAATYSDAIARVTERLETRYGSLDQALGQEEISSAYTQMVGITGLFNQSGVADESVLRSTEEMVALAMSDRRNGKSLFEEMADRFAGQRVLLESEQMYRQFLSEGGETESDEGQYRRQILDDYQQAVESDRGAQNRFLIDLGREQRERVSFADSIQRFDQSVDQREIETRRQNLSSAIGLFAGPLAIAALDSGLSVSDNLMSRGLDLIQGFASADELRGRETSQISNATLFQVARLRDQMHSEDSLVVGGIRGILSESMYGAMSQVSYEMFGANRRRGVVGGALGAVAEVASTALSLAASRLMSGRKVGAQNETYQDYLGQTVGNIAEQVGLYMQAALEAQSDPEIEMEDTEGEIYYEFDREIHPNEYQEKISSGWIDVEMNSEDGGELGMVEAL